MKGFTILIMSLFAVVLFSTQAYACPDITAESTQELIQEIPSINEQLQSCPIKLESGISLVVGKTTQVDILMNDGTVNNYTITVSKGEIVEISEGAASCKKKVSTSEEVLDRILSSENRNSAVLDAFAEKELDIQGCTFLSKAGLFFTKPIGRFFAGFSS